ELGQQRFVPARWRLRTAPAPSTPEKTIEQVGGEVLSRRQYRGQTLQRLPALGAVLLKGGLELAFAVRMIDSPQVIGLKQVSGTQGHAAIVLSIEKGKGKVAAVHFDHRQTQLFDDLPCNRLLLLQRLHPLANMPCGLP